MSGKKLVLCLLSFCLLLFLGINAVYFIVYGKGGILELSEVREEVAYVTSLLENRETDYAELEKALTALKNKDKDMLDEQIRRSIGLSREGDTFVYIDS